MKRPFVTGLLGLVLVACATSSLPPIRDANVRLEEDEQRMWARVEQEQKKFDASGALYRDAELDAYLTGVARKLQPPAVLQVIPFRVAVVKNPWLNAFAMPNGALYIHSGLLARLDNEAQLAAVLGHEMVHVTHRHAIREFRSTQNKAAFFATMNVTLGGVPVLGGIADLVGAEGGPYHLSLGIAENRLAFDVRREDGNAAGKVILPLQPFRGVVKDYFTVCESYYAAIRNAGLELPDRPRAEDLQGRLVNCFIKSEADHRARLRGRRQIMLDDSDVHHHRHSKAAVGGVAAAAIGDPAVFVSVDAMHQGPHGGGPVIAIVDVGD